MALTLFTSEVIPTETAPVEISNEAGEAAVDLLEAGEGEAEGNVDENGYEPGTGEFDDEEPGDREADEGEPVGETGTGLDNNEQPAPQSQDGPQPQPVAVESVSAHTHPAGHLVDLTPTDAKALAREAWKRRIAEAKERFIEAAMKRSECEAELKEAKADEKAALKLVSEIINRGPQPMPLFDNSNSAEGEGAKADETNAVAADSTAGKAGESATGGESASPAADSDAWRSAPISSLSLKPKLQERLEENGTTTIGKLEDLRAAIALGHEKWPKGIGQAKITEIENAMVDWLTKNRDSHLFGHQGSGQAKISDEEQIYNDNREFADLANARAVEIEASGDITPKLECHREWQCGHEAYNQGAEIGDCDYLAGEKQDDWIRGWFQAAKDAEKAEEKAEAGGDSTNNEKAEQPRDINVDDL